MPCFYSLHSGPARRHTIRLRRVSMASLLFTPSLFFLCIPSALAALGGPVVESDRTAVSMLGRTILARERALPHYPITVPPPPSVPVGDCTARARVRGLTIVGTTVDARIADQRNAIDCLIVQKNDIERACSCIRIDILHTDDPDLERQILDVSRKIRTSEKLLRNAGIQNKAIQSYVSEVAKVRDCVNVRALHLLQSIQHILDREMKTFGVKQ